jgi:hypothetical protein
LDEERHERQRERIAANEALDKGESNLPRIEIGPLVDQDTLPNEEVEPSGSETKPIDENVVVPIDLFEDGESEHEEEEQNWLNLLGTAIDQIDDEPADNLGGQLVPAFCHEVDQIEEVMDLDSQWFPFLSKEVRQQEQFY